MPKKIKLTWLKQPEEKDYAAAESLLSLIIDEKTAARYIRRARKAPISEFKARDILRMSSYSALGIVASDEERKHILVGKPMSPLLLLRDPLGGRVIVADGFHRLCTVYAIDGEAMVRCKVV